jgi:opacity protein-like surface antigen
MVNAIVKLPFGLHEAFQPYFSGGIGSIGMHTSLLAFDTTTGSTFNAKSSQSEFGYDLGAGTAAFAGHWGFRFDVRWYKASSSSATIDQLTINNVNRVQPIGSGLNTIGDGTVTGNGTAANNLTKALVSGLDFWRTNIGLAFRW